MRIPLTKPQIRLLEKEIDNYNQLPITYDVGTISAKSYIMPYVGYNKDFELRNVYLGLYLAKDKILKLKLTE